MSENQKLTMGPLLYNWPAEKKRDFYFKIADEAPVDVVYIGEVTCSKRTPFFAPYIPNICERLEASGKRVIISSLALVMSGRERGELNDLVLDCPWEIEANDLSAISLLSGKPHVVGPFVNLYNEGTLNYLYQNGATRIVLPCELPICSIARLTESAKGREIEIQAFGRLPLALSARCYHARSHNLPKDGCLYVCENDLDGMDVSTLDGDPFLAINGTHTMSYTVNNLLNEIKELSDLGVSHFRLWPHDEDMVKIAEIYRRTLDGDNDLEKSNSELDELVTFAPFSNGFYHAVEGVKQVE